MKLAVINIIFTQFARHCLKTFIKVHTFVTVYIDICTRYFLITCHVPGTMLRECQTILFLIHNSMLKWTVLVIVMTASKITHPYFLSAYCIRRIFWVLSSAWIISLVFATTQCVMYCSCPFTTWEKLSRQRFSDLFKVPRLVLVEPIFKFESLWLQSLVSVSPTTTSPCQPFPILRA